MDQILEIDLDPEKAFSDLEIKNALINKGMSQNGNFLVLKKSIDARGRKVKYKLRCKISEDIDLLKFDEYNLENRDVSSNEEVHIIGSGPCGLFAALELIKKGYKPIIFERGKDVRNRRRDLAKLNKEHIVDPNSNYCFGEGGAGTYSDGKLYTRSKKRGSVNEILKILVAFGADQNIMIDAHPHIGTNKLPKIITSIREYIISCGGELHFNSKLSNFKIREGEIKEIEINNAQWIKTKSIILATGHSARDIFILLSNHKISIQAKPFALGVRVEHPQQIIDRIQYKCEERGDYLPPASYSLVNQINGKGVYSFCMCPGGIIAPCATATEEIVTNGWSPSKRNNPYANSGLVVSIDPKDFDPQGTGNPLQAMYFQSQVERSAWELGGKSQVAPAQRLVDFVDNKVSIDLPKCSYQPGILSSSLRECLPNFVSQSIAQSLKVFGNKMKGYYTNEAVLVATESRTSSPVRIPRTENLNHPEIKNLFPAGEGAGYAGGIVSAAIDGQKIAVSLSQKMAF